MKFKTILILFILSIALASCDTLLNIADSIDTGSQGSAKTPLTEGEVVKGLKRALDVGAENAVSDLSVTNSFYGNNAYKILLPPEAKIITDNKNNSLLQAVGITDLINDVEKSMNKAAEKAVIKAKPIFINAIKNMSIQDAFEILNGGDTAATHFLRIATSSTLYSQFKPEVSKVLDQPVMQGVSTNKAWSNLTTSYNQVAMFVPKWNKVNTKLDAYVTDKALYALFEQVKIEESKIRKDPMARIDDILKRVFGN